MKEMPVESGNDSSGRRPGKGPVDRLAQLRKILELESARGFADQAVAGGLDKYLQKWRSELTGSLGKDPCRGVAYADLTPTARRDWAHALLYEPSRKPFLSRGERQAGVAGRRSSTPPPPEGRSKASRSVETSPSPPPFPAGRGRLRPPPSALDSPLADLKLCTRSTAQRLASMGVRTLRDLLYFFPNRHIDYATVTRIRDLQIGQDASVVATIWEASEARIGPPPGATRAVVSDGTGTMGVTWFRQSYLAKKLGSGTRLVLSGKVGEFRGRPQFQNPEYEILGEAGGEDDLLHAGNLLPVYPSTEGLVQRTLRNAAKNGLELGLPLLRDVLPDEITVRNRLVPLPKAVSDMHLPGTTDDREAARRRIAFDELFLNQLAVQKRRIEWRKRGEGVAVRVDRAVIESSLVSLHFELTAGQAKALDEILAEISRDVPMSRLLQGEVGSGKTIIAIASLVGVAAAGFQGAIMAPTEVLAEQHFLNLCTVLSARPVFGQPDAVSSARLPSPRPSPSPSPGGRGNQMSQPRVSTASPSTGEAGIPSSLRGEWPVPTGAEGSGRRPDEGADEGEGAGNVRVALLIGALPSNVKTAVQRRIAEGQIDLIVGTHALIEEAVQIPHLALAVVDEQHRFGVEQRAALKQKGLKPHLLAMSATPIPRSLALTLYGDLDLSTLSELPRGRRPIETRWIRDSAGRSYAYQLVQKEVAAGRQAFVVCPLIDLSEEIRARSAVEEHSRLSATVFPDLRVGLLHGRMSLTEKQTVMERFRSGDLQVLVATPVIEVGIDMPNATVMLIESADRFGLSQLHQLRGRVGRGAHKSYCILLSDDLSSDAEKRLATVERTNDGFQLAEKDLDLRGPGDYLGIRQSGFADLKVAKLSDIELLSLSRSDAERLLAEDPDLGREDHAPLAKELARATASRPAEIS
ncbi:MAG: ATP-dependent DNA helicase RecG [Chloroflexi bacterium]|nr:ATP-dependent DNA helicase RecG [Chloroflexota bacterium]